MHDNDWTVERAKAELPDIPIKFKDGTEGIGHLGGGRVRFATVFILVHGSTLSTSAAWETLVYCLNESLPLSV